MARAENVTDDEKRSLHATEEALEVAANVVETVTLPALPVGRCYVSIASELVIRLSCGAGNRTFKAAMHTDAIVDGTYAYGLKQVTADGGALGTEASDDDKKAGVLKRCDAIDSGSHAYGAGGGGARLSTYIIVLRENVAMELSAIGMKMAEAKKITIADPVLAYRKVAEEKANSMREDAADKDKSKVTTDIVLGILWANMCAESRKEADRRDKVSGKAPEPDSDMLAAVLAKATESEDNPADEIVQAA